MIRFLCQKCGRESVVSNALSGLPLLCKGCGDRVIVPDASESLPEPPPAPPPPKPHFERSLPVPSPADEKPDILVSPTIEDSEVNLFLSPEARKSLFLPIEGSGPAPPPQPMPPLPEPAPPLPAEQPRKRINTKLVDGACLLIALCIGAFAAEFIAKKSTLQIFGDAPASTRFPPTDLAIWVGSVATFGLCYVWLIARGWSLGARFKRR